MIDGLKGAKAIKATSFMMKADSVVEIGLVSLEKIHEFHSRRKFFPLSPHDTSFFPLIDHFIDLKIGKLLTFFFFFLPNKDFIFLLRRFLFSSN